MYTDIRIMYRIRVRVRDGSSMPQSALTRTRIYEHIHTAFACVRAYVYIAYDMRVHTRARPRPRSSILYYVALTGFYNRYDDDRFCLNLYRTQYYPPRARHRHHPLPILQHDTIIILYHEPHTPVTGTYSSYTSNVSNPAVICTSLCAISSDVSRFAFVFQFFVSR